MDLPVPANDSDPDPPPPASPPHMLALYLALDLAAVGDQLDELMARLFERDLSGWRLANARSRLLPPLQEAVTRCRTGLARR